MASKHTLSYQLAEIIDSRGLSAYALAKLAEVDPGVVSRWMTGKRDIRLETADKIAEALGLRLVETARSRPARQAARPPRPTGRHPEPGPGPDQPAEAAGMVEAEGCQLAVEVEADPVRQEPQPEPMANFLGLFSARAPEQSGATSEM
jgi:transcriptional regulator with XRE-family HTH domain